MESDRTIGHDEPLKLVLKKDTVLRSAGLEKWAPPISWLGNRKLRFHWGESLLN